MGRHDDDQRIYRTFEEFEREELRRMDTLGASVGDILDEIFEEELDFDMPTSSRGRRARDEDDADDEE